MWDITNATHPPTMRGASLQWPDQGRERVVGDATASMLVLTTTAGPEPPFSLSFLPADPLSRTATHDPDGGSSASPHVPARPGVMWWRDGARGSCSGDLCHDPHLHPLPPLREGENLSTPSLRKHQNQDVTSTHRSPWCLVPAVRVGLIVWRPCGGWAVDRRR